MLQVKKLQKGDKVAIVSLSSGVLGESFVKHEYYLGIKNLRELGLEPVFMPNSLKGIDFIKNNPQARFEDLKQAFADKEIKAIMCAIGGNDAYLLTEYVLQDKDFASIVKSNPKIFIGFSDSTTNHLLLNSLGLHTFYGMSFLTDFAEFHKDMLPYTKSNFKTLFTNKINERIKPSNYWYYERDCFDESQLGVPRKRSKNSGYILLKGAGKAVGKLYGGCLEVLYREVQLYKTGEYEGVKCKSAILDKNMFKDCIILLETSEEKPSPEKFRTMVKELVDFGLFNKCHAVLLGKPQNQVYMRQYHKIIVKELSTYNNIIILANLNVGHAQPHTLMPLGAKIEVDANKKSIQIKEAVLF